MIAWVPALNSQPMFPPRLHEPAVSSRAAAGRLLAIDCSTERLVLAVSDGDRHFTRDEEGAARASSRLLPLAFELLGEAGMDVSMLDAVAFAAGPGAFTGLRTACACAQGLAVGRGLPLLALDSLALVAEDARAQGVRGAGWVAMDARMGEAYAGAYHWQDDGWLVDEPPALWAPDELAARWAGEPPAWVAGSALAALGLPCGAARRVEHAHDRAAALLRLAQQAWQAGAEIDAAQALPLYVRDKVAFTTAERLSR
jgi:tRNA threonylcarbamoyladenosine biosynthesis protein TsaB